MKSRAEPLDVAIVGAGADALELLAGLQRWQGVRVTGLVDSRLRRARRLADRFQVRAVHGTLDDLVRAGSAQAVLVACSGTERMAAVERLVQAGLPVCTWMPADTDLERFEAVVQKARERSVPLWFVERFSALARPGRLAMPRHLSLIHRTRAPFPDMPDLEDPALASEAALFASLGSELLSTLVRLLTALSDVRATVGQPRTLVDGRRIHCTWLVQGVSEHGSVSARFGFGAEVEESVLEVSRPERTERVDLKGAPLVAAVMPFLHSLGVPAPEARIGQELPVMDDGVQLARQTMEVLRQVMADARVETRAFVPETVPVPGPSREGEVVVLGACHPAGLAIVRHLLALDVPTTVVSPRPESAHQVLRDVRLRRLAGDLRVASTMDTCLAGARHVIFVLDGTPNDEPEDRIEELVLAAENVGAVCLRERVQRLVVISDARVAHLGTGLPATTGRAPDATPWFRPLREQALVHAERVLRRLHVEHTLRAVFLRPALLVGPEVPVLVPGLGRWLPDGTCIGYGTGIGGLPLVLSGDVAKAAVSALTAKAVVGKTYDLAGDVRPSGAELLWQIRSRRQQSVRYVPRPLFWWFLSGWLRFLVRFPTHAPAPLPSWRELGGRAWRSTISSTDARRDLHWQPEADQQVFYRQWLDDR